MPKGKIEYNGCKDCFGYKFSAASLLQPYQKPELEAYSQNTPTYNAMPLKEATNDFLNNYIRSASKYYNTTQINALRKNMNVTREGLTNLIKKTGTSLDDISEELNKNSDYFINDPTDEVKDPIEKYLIQSASGRGFNLKEDTALFKRTYANNMARTFGFYNASKDIGYQRAIELDTKDIIKYGINDAAETLGITPRRMQDLVKDYYISVKNPNVETETTAEENKEKQQGPSLIERESEAERSEKQRIKELKEREIMHKENRRKPVSLEEELSKAA